MTNLTAERLRSLLLYDPETGYFCWRITKANKNAGELAGCIAPSGYVFIGIDGRIYRAHRLVWLYLHGVWPENQMDHVNLDRSDNRIANLRLASSAQNKANRRKDCRNRSGLKGAYWDRERQNWSSFIKTGGKSRFLGRHASKEAAHAAYVAAANDLFGEFARTS